MAQIYFLNWQEILEQLRSFLPPSWKANQAGKVLKRLQVAFALAVEALYALLARLLRLAILATSEGEWLRAIVRGWGMETFEGTPANLTIRFSRFDATSAVSVPANVEVGAQFGQIFKTTINATIPVGVFFADVPCVCTQPGTFGNIRAGEIVNLLTPVTGVDEVLNPNPATGGRDPESDIEIKNRVPKYLESLHRATIPATEYVVGLDRERFPEVRGFVTQRNYGSPGYFRAILSDASGGELYRAKGWTESGNGVWFVSTPLTEINGLVAAGFPCRRFGIVERTEDGEETWKPSLFVAEVEQGTWRFCHDKNLGRLYARADGRDLNTLEITIVSGVIFRALRTLELEWAANGVFCDVLVPFVVQGIVSLTYSLEPGYQQTAVEIALRSAVSDYIASLGLGQDLEPEGLYAALSLVAGAAGVLVISPATNVAVPPFSVFRLSALPTVTRQAA